MNEVTVNTQKNEKYKARSYSPGPDLKLDTPTYEEIKAENINNLFNRYDVKVDFLQSNLKW